MQISVDGPAAVHDRYRVYPSGAGSFSGVVDLVRRIGRRSSDFLASNVVFIATLCPPFRLDEIVEFFNSPPFDKSPVIINSVNGLTDRYHEIFPREHHGPRLEESLAPVRDKYHGLLRQDRRDDVDRVLRSLFDKRFADLTHRHAEASSDAIPLNGICVPGQRRLFVTVDGRFFPCEKVGGYPQIGHVDHGFDMKAIKACIAEYRQLCTTICHDCWAAKLCRQCFATCHHAGVVDPTTRQRACASERSFWDRTLSEFAATSFANPRSFDFLSEMTFR